jgi:LmbE family N-acetylglucosaminyl deacetylase
MHKLMSVRKFLQSLHALRARSGPYRFLVRDWSGLSDIEVAAKVVATEFFRNELTPLELPVTGLKRILMLAPHQDDETIGAGGALLLAAAAGAKIDVLYITDGSSGKRDDAWVTVRNQEAQKVCDRLGATMHHLGISNAKPEPKVRHLERLSNLMHELKPDVLMTPWLLDSPAKHRLVHHLLWLAEQYCGLPATEVWGYQVHNAVLPNGYVDITAVAEQKRMLLECFRSQNENWTNYTHIAMGMAAWNAHLIRSTEPRYLEVFNVLPLDESLKLVEKFYFQNLRATYRDHANVIAGASALHDIVTGRGRSGAGRAATAPPREPQPELLK